MTGSGAPTPSKHLRVSRPVRVVAYFFGFLFLCYLIVVAAMSTAWFNRALRERTRTAFERVTGGRVEIGQMEINAWIFQATFRGLVMHGSETGAELPLFAARELVLRVSPSALVRRHQLRVMRADLEGAEIHLYTRPDGSTNLPGPAAHAEGLASLDDLINLGIRQLLVAQSNFYWDDRQWPLALSARDLAVVLGLRQGSYSGSISASTVSVSNPELRLPALTISTRLALARNSLNLDSLVWRSQAVKGSGTLAIHWIPTLESQFSFRLEGDASPVARILRRNEIRQGTFSADGEGAYRAGTVEARGHLELRHVVIARRGVEPSPMEFGSDYVLSGRGVQFPRLTASLLGGVARGSAEILFRARTPSFKADLELQDFDLTRTLASLPGGAAVLSDFPVASRAGGHLQMSAQGGVSESRFDLDFEPSGLGVAGREPLAGFARGTATSGPIPLIELESAELRFAHSILRLHGWLGEAAASLTVRLDTSSFGEWHKAAEVFAGRPLPVKLDSTATFSGSVTGPVERPLVEGKLQVGNFEYGGWNWDGLQANVTAQPNQLQVTSGRLLGAHSVLTLELTAGLERWQFAPDSPLELRAGADKTSIQALREVLGIRYPLSGELTGQLHLNTAHHQLAAEGTFRVARGSYDGEPFDRVGVNVRTERGLWKLTRFDLIKGHGQVTGDGTFDPAARTLRAQAQGHEFSLADFSRLQNLALAGGANAAGGIDGMLSFDVQTEGSVDHPSAHASVHIQELSAGNIPLGNLTGAFDSSGRQTTLRGQLEGPAGKLNFQGSGQLGSPAESDWPIELSAQYSGLRLDPWLRALGLARVQGTVETTGSFDYSGELRGPAPPRIKGDIQTVQVNWGGLRWQNDRPFVVTIANHRLNLMPFHLQGPSTLFRLQGTADLGPSPALDLTAEGQIDSQFLHVFDPALLTTGHFDMKLEVQGTFRQPLLYGSLHVDQVSIGYPGLPLRLAGLNGDVDLQGDRLAIRSLRAESGPASVTIAGSAILSGTPRYSLRADLSHMRVAYPVQFTSVVSGSVQLSGTPGAGLLRGDLTVEQMFIGENFNVLNWAAELANQPGTTLGAITPLSSSVRIDVHVGSSPAVSVESHDLTAVASIDISLRGDIATPVVFGTVHIQNGSAVLRQTTYKLSHGDITMANPLRTEPVLDLEATTRIQRYDLVLRVTGPADRPNVSYRSDPPLSTPSILALLAFGYTTQDQLIANTGRSAFSSQGASALLSQALSSQASSRVTRLFGLSRISIDPNPISTGGTQVTVEERLARDFTITYVTTTGGIQERIIQVEWDVSDSVSLLGIRDQNGVYGMELDFRRRFK